MQINCFGDQVPQVLYLCSREPRGRSPRSLAMTKVLFHIHDRTLYAKKIFKENHLKKRARAAQVILCSSFKGQENKTSNFSIQKTKQGDQTRSTSLKVRWRMIASCPARSRTLIGMSPFMGQRIQTKTSSAEGPSCMPLKLGFQRGQYAEGQVG